MNATAPKNKAQHAQVHIANEAQVAQLVAAFEAMDEWGRNLLLSMARKQAASNPQERDKHCRLLKLFDSMQGDAQNSTMHVVDVLARKFPKSRPALRLVTVA